MARVLITGGTGLVGKRLTQMLIAKNHEVLILSRNPKKKNEFRWDVSSNYVDEKALINIDYIIHLAGAGIADKRWSKKRKQVIIDSRVETANLLFEKITTLNIKLKGFISASGIGYYGAVNSQIIFEETAKVGTDFLGNTCKKWEEAAHQFSRQNTPVTILRTGIVLAKKGGVSSLIHVARERESVRSSLSSMSSPSTTDHCVPLQPYTAEAGLNLTQLLDDTSRLWDKCGNSNRAEVAAANYVRRCKHIMRETTAHNDRR